uniref:Cation efflux protein transmembrane domain-containing protein n=1 Tax=Strigamia maritima TaxID=126957 RepID=T1JLQ2_STRMM
MTVKDYQEQNEVHRKNIKQQDSLFRGTGRVVLTAITINACNFALKLLAWMYTGSHSLFSEAIHSFADTVNQLILAYGIHKSIQAADYDHPINYYSYGYMNMRYVASLISGVGIFCFGTGISIYHGIHGLIYPEPSSSLYWAFFILGGSLVSEGGIDYHNYYLRESETNTFILLATLLVAFNAIRKGAKNTEMSIKDYILRAQDPLVNVVLLEDFAAVLGVSIAAICMGLSSLYESTIPDAVGSILIGGLLGVVAAVIINTNTTALVGR